MLTLHALALGTVLTDGKQHPNSKIAGLSIQVRPIGAVRAAPGTAYDMAKADLKAGNVAQALEGFRQAVREAPQSVDALNGLAVAYDLLGRYDQSRVYYEAALAVDPVAAVVASNYGYSLFQQGDFTGARPLLEAAVRGDDAAARASSRNTLQLIARRVTAPVEVAEVPRAPERGSWIEQSTNGEQRLVLDAPVAAGLAGANPAEMALVAPAVEWTSLDDARVDRAARVESAALDAAAAAAAKHAPAVGAAPVEYAEADPAAASATPAAHPKPVQLAAKTEAPDIEVTLARVQAAAAPAPVDLRAPRLVATSGYRLIAATATTDPSRRRRAATIQVGGLELARQLVAANRSTTAEPVGLGLDRLTHTLTHFGTAAEDEIGFSGSAFERLSAGLGMLAAVA